MTEKEFVAYWTSRLCNERLKSFPEDFSPETETEVVTLPGVNLLKGEELFGSYEIVDSRGNPVYLTESLARLKYILYSSRLKPHSVRVPVNEERTQEAVKLYEKYLDRILRDIDADYRVKFPKDRNFASVSNDIFNALNLKRL